MTIDRLLDAVSAFLFVPVAVALLALVCWMLLVCGAFLRSVVSRLGGGHPGRTRYLAMLDSAAAVGGRDAELDLHLQEIVQRAELESARSLNLVRFAIRAGPSLGLMGTLIPMAAALSGLAQGDLPALAGRMTTAFSSTVIGIAIGLVAYVVTLVRETWIRADLDAIRFHAERRLRAAED